MKTLKKKTIISLIVIFTMVLNIIPIGVFNSSVNAAGEAPVITTDGPLPHAWVGQPYSAQLTATGSTPITWTNPLTFLPDGLTLDSSTGVISGIPTTTSTGLHMFTARNEYGHDTKNISLYVFDEDSKPSITTSSLPNGTVGQRYNQHIGFTGVDYGDNEWTIISGNLPNGLSLNGRDIQGFPTLAGTYSFTLKVTNPAGSTQKDFTINIYSADSTINYSVSPTDVIIPTSAEGYNKWDLKQTITIKNNSSFRVSYNINDSSLVNFEVNGFYEGDGEFPEYTDTFRILPIWDLTPGTYNETLTMEIWEYANPTNRITKNIDITFTVTGTTPTQHTVTYDFNGGTPGSISGSFQIDDGDTLNFSTYKQTMQNNVTAPINKEFDAFEIDGTRWDSGDYTVNGPITLKVLWKDKSSVIVNTINYSVSPVDVTIPTSDVGYNKWDLEQTITIKNNSTFNVSYNINDSSLVNFEVNGFYEGDNESPNYTDTFRILPIWDLTPGTYNETLTMEIWQSNDTTNRITKNINITFTVTGSLIHTHTPTLVPAKAPTCSAEGNNAYYTCTCGEVFKDASGHVTTTVAAETLPIDANAHNWDGGTITTYPTCTSEGVKTYTCLHNSSHTKTETVDREDHTIINVPAVAVDCETDGNIEYYKCAVCDHYFEDIGGTVEILDKSSVVIAKTGHNWGAWTQTIAPTQTTDGEEERVCQHNSAHKQTRPIPMLSHTHTLNKTDEVPATCETTGTKAYWTCSGCGRLFSDSTGTTEIDAPEVIAKTEHSWDTGTVTTPATCTSEGVKTYTCLHNSSHTKTETIAKKAHTLTAVTAVAPTCEVDGIKAHYKCSECNKTFEDALGNVEMTSIVDPATGHDWNEWVEITPVTVDTTGEKTRTCKHDSSHKETATIDKLALEITEGANKTYTLNSGAEVKIKCNGTFTNFDRLTSNGTEIADSNYDKESGSTVVTLKNSYLDSLSEGTYKLAFVYNDGRSAETNLTIAKAGTNNSNEDVNKQEDSNTNNNQASGTTSENNSSSISPKTGDNIMIWIALMVVAVIGTIGAIRYIRKKD